MKNIFKLFFYTGILIILTGILLILCIVFVNKKINEPLKIEAQSQIFEVGIGDGARKIASNLESQKIISNRNYFLYYLWQTNSAVKLQAGKYLFSASSSIKEVADRIIKGEAIKEETQITIPEGFRMSEIEKRLVEKNLIKRDDFINFNYDSSGPVWDKHYDFLYQDCKGRWCILEGYLFPDTYNFPSDDLLSVDDVVIKFLDNFDKKTKLLRDEMKTREAVFITDFYNLPLKPRKVDFHDIVIMASILEKEVRTLDDMKMVSGLLWKRISIGMPLQVDATIAYITGKKTGEITRDDLKIISPFNAYLNKGLPLGPISNPGLIALDAALNPTQSDYLYYLSKPTGETVFSKTLEEHNRAKNLYLK